MMQLLLAIIYIAFISLGLPDGLLGSAWPSMYRGFDVPVSYAGAISMLIALGTIVSSLQSDRLTKRLGVGRVTVISVGITALALFGFSVSNSFWMLCVLAIPYGLGAGGVDAALNNYVALHYTSRHMSWLHCMWGVGAWIGPYIMGYALTSGQGWNSGYRYVAILQGVLVIGLLLSQPLWGGHAKEVKVEQSKRVLSLSEIIRIPGAKEIMITFFCYCSIEMTTGLWGSSYLNLHNGVGLEEAARFAGLFYLGITIGRGICGFITMRMSDEGMVRLGGGIIFLGIVGLLLPTSLGLAQAGLVMIGLGCAPVYPCIIHATPVHFGADRSQAIIGVQMASAYVGTCLVPPLFGLIAQYIDISLFPIFLLSILTIMLLMHERMILKTKNYKF